MIINLLNVRLLSVGVLSAVLSVLVLSVAVKAEGGATTVRPDSTNWVEVNSSALSADFIDDTSSPLGEGALVLTKQDGFADVPTAPQLGNTVPLTPLYKTDVNDLLLSDLYKLEYFSKYIDGVTTVSSPGLQMVIDSNGSAPEGLATLYLDFSSKEPLVSGDGWKKWDVYNHSFFVNWRSMSDLNNVGAFQQKGVNLAGITFHNPDAIIKEIGFSTPGIVDALTINETIFDFEPAPSSAPTKQDCKKEKWESYTANYKNQGLCISLVEKQTNMVDKALLILKELF